MGEADMQCFEAISIFRVARCFRCHCHFLLGQTLGIHFRRRPLSTIESMPGQRHGVSKEKDEHFPFSRINQAEPDGAIFSFPSRPTRGAFSSAARLPPSPAVSAAIERWICSAWKRSAFFVLRIVFVVTVTFC